MKCSLIVAGVVILVLSACDSGAPVQSAPPQPPTSEQVFLSAMHAEEVLLPDMRMLELARHHCTVLRSTTGVAAAREDQVQMLVIGSSLTQQQAQSFVYHAEQVFCPDKLGG